MTNFRFVLAVISVPTLTAIFGLLWLWDKKKKKRLPRKDSTDEGLSLHGDLPAGNESDLNQETLVSDKRKNEEGEDGVTLLHHFEEISINASNSLTTSSYRNSKLKSKEIRQLNGRRDVSPGQHVDTCIAAAVDDTALCYQLPGKRYDLEDALPGNDGIGNIGVAGGGKITDRNPTDSAYGQHLSGGHLLQSDRSSDAVVESDTAAILAMLHSGAGISPKCTNRGDGAKDLEPALLVSSCTEDATESFLGKNLEEEVEAEEEEEKELVSSSSHSCHGDVGAESHSVSKTKDEEEEKAEAQECELGRQEASCVSASKLDSPSTAANAAAGDGDTWVTFDEVRSGSKQQDSELSGTQGLSGSSGFDRNTSDHNDDDYDGDDDDLLGSDVQVNAVDDFQRVSSSSAEFMGDSSIVQIGDIIIDSDSPAQVTEVGKTLCKQGDKVNVDLYSQVKSMDAISAVFASNSLNDSKLKRELESLRGSTETTQTSTPKRETTDNLLLSAKELFHETKSITPPETESEKEVLTESMESDPVAGDDDSRDISMSEGGQSDGSGDVYLSSLSQTPTFRQQKKGDPAAENSVTKSSSSTSYSSLPVNSMQSETETVQCRSEESGAEGDLETVQCQSEESGAEGDLKGPESDDADHLRAVDSSKGESLISESLLLTSTTETASENSKESGTSVELCGRDVGAGDSSSFGSSDQNMEGITHEQQLQSGGNNDSKSGGRDNNDIKGDGHDETLSKTDHSAVASNISSVGEEAPDAGHSGTTLPEEEEQEEEEGEMVQSNLVDNTANCDVTDHCVPQDGSKANQTGSSSKLEYNAATFVPPDSNFQSNSSPSCDFTNVPQCEDTVQNASSNKIYEFYFPSDLCGRLIGRQGKTISQIKERSGAYVTLQPSPYTPNHQICSIDGSEEQIQEALKCITEKFPPSVYGNVDLTPIRGTSQMASNPVVMPDLIQLSLPQEGVSVNVLVASIIDVGHLFLQLPTHPTYVALNRLNKFMNRCYSQPDMVPHLPRPLAAGVICAAPMMDSWYRAVIVAVSEDSDECEIKFVDYGGYSQVLWNDLRQIRSDFMTLPFQAVEVYLANITPLPDEPYFSDSAVETLQQLTESGILQAQVVSRAEDGTPYVHIYQINGNKVMMIATTSHFLLSCTIFISLPLPLSL
ncbi:uncharacterized protein LOC115230553, partial [Octopus sinensis]|uniref:Uncharacterized protein LOC115230553 n=1 Tax=Octopus sinensis TaxID=2607531 RepID=A0A6P7TVY2_9MOLL